LPQRTVRSSGSVSFLALASSRATLAGGLKVSLVVGTILNAINQGDRLLALRFAEVVWWKIALTYLVPFCVSVFSATRIRMLFLPGLSAHRDARLVCRTCGSARADVRSGDVVPRCSTCGPRTSWRPLRG
jgi:hypothetical protein